MKIVRFLDTSNRVVRGREHPDGTITRLDGEIFKELKDSGQKIQVKKLLTPVTPTAILCIGLNYRQHAAETGSEIPRYPVLFMKNPGSVCHPQDPILLPKSCVDPPQVDYEGELAVVIGKPAKNVSESAALDYVIGYTIGNDISARRWQKHAGGGQWIRGKSFDTFCPLGPRIVTSDELTDPQNLELKSFVNGEVMQNTNTGDMIFPVTKLLSYLSESTTLLPGTIIMTGTPGGVGYKRTPPVYLHPGDTVEVSIDCIGRLTNRVALEE